MRIVMDATPLLGHRTGVGRYAHHLLTELPAALGRADLAPSVDVTTWTARGGGLTHLPEGVRQVGPPLPARVLRAAWSRIDHPRIEALVGACDVFHGTNFVTPPTRRAREVVMVHDLTYELHQRTVSADSLAYRDLVPRALGRGAHVVTPSWTVAEAVQDFYSLEPARVTATPLGIEDAWFTTASPTPDELRTMGLPESYLLFVGSVDPRKNLPRLLAAHAALRAQSPDVPALVLAGPAGREQGLDPHAHVHRTGWLDDATLRRVVAGSRALVLPSLDEGFGLPALEALACGRPVVVSDIASLREVTADLGVRCRPDDVDDIAAAIAAVLVAPDGPADRARRMAHARRWTWAACADATVGVYLR